MERHTSVDWAALDDAALGCANQAGEDNRNVAGTAVRSVTDLVEAGHLGRKTGRDWYTYDTAGD